ncbi:MAG: hypothetical protein U0559_02280 [Anaerolineae bacterium]
MNNGFYFVQNTITLLSFAALLFRFNALLALIPFFRRDDSGLHRAVAIRAVELPLAVVARA